MPRGVAYAELGRPHRPVPARAPWDRWLIILGIPFEVGVNHVPATCSRSHFSAELDICVFCTVRGLTYIEAKT